MFHRTRRDVTWLIATGLLVSLAACSSATSTTSAAGTASPAGTHSSATSPGAATQGYGCPAARGKLVGFSEPIADPNFTAIEHIVRASLASDGVTLKALNANLNPPKQISDIGTMLQQQVSVLIANPVDPHATEGVFGQVRARGIPIVALDTKIGGPYFTTVHDDMEYAGSEGAKALKRLVGSGSVGEIAGPPFAEVLTWERQAFEAEARQIGLRVVAVGVNQQLNAAGGAQIAAAWKVKYGSAMKGVWTTSDSTAIGVVSTLGSGFSPQIVSINGQPEALPLVKSGKISTTFGVPYDKTGQVLAWAALQALCKKTVPQTIFIPTIKLTAANVGSWEPISQRLNNPFQLSFEDRNGQTFVKYP
jgi:ribose transport system substrate-binding protein